MLLRTSGGCELRQVAMVRDMLLLVVSLTITTVTLGRLKKSPLILLGKSAAEQLLG